MASYRSTKLKVTIGYTLLLAILLFSLVFVHREMETLSAADDQENLRTDSLLTLLHEKDRNTIQMLRVLSEANDSLLSASEIEEIISEQDSVITQQRVQHRVITKRDSLLTTPKKKGFFKRLAEVFVPTKQDSAVLVNTSMEVATDTILEPTTSKDSLQQKIRMATEEKRLQRRKTIRRTSTKYQRMNSQLTARMDSLIKQYEEEMTLRARQDAEMQQEVRMRSARTIGGIAIGAVLLLPAFVPKYGMEGIFISVFTSVSAFCNAGFSTLSGNLGNPMVMTNHNWLFISVSLLIIFGGIGFPILVNFKDIVLYHLRHFWKFVRTRKLERHKVSHLYNLNTRIVLIMTFLLLVTGTLAIAAFEWNASFAGMPVADKWTQAFFNATCPRTAGFSSVDLASLSVQTLLVYLVLMWIGGGAQSTAGGVKVNAFAVVVLNLVAVLRGSERVEVFGRELSHDSIRRSNATVVMSLGVLFLFIFILSILEPQASLMALTFECVSALSTVGSSLNLTPNLCDASKLLVALLMFIGRVGLITLMLGIIKQKKNTKYRYPSDNIIIN